MRQLILTNKDVHVRAARCAMNIRAKLPMAVTCYAIPRGGVPAAYALLAFSGFGLVDNPEHADFFFDDIIDSGETARRYKEKYGKPTFALVDKIVEKDLGWVVFPWEGDAAGGIEDNVRRIIQHIGDDTERGGLLETPKRVAKAYAEWFDGYDKDVKPIFKTFEDGGDNYDEMVVVKDIPFYSHCEHHIAPFFGTATIAYIPVKKIVGLSKLSRLLDVYAHRLQVQERLTSQVTDAIDKHMSPRGVGCVIKARHLCMESRGIRKQGHHTITNSLRGVFKTDPATRAEFMELAK